LKPPRPNSSRAPMSKKECLKVKALSSSPSTTQEKKKKRKKKPGVVDPTCNPSTQE
jgi:hypothetical protein